MPRALVMETGLFLLPFALYGMLIYARRRTLVLEDWTPQALGLIGLAGLVLVVLGLLVFERGRGAAPGSVYIPAHIEDGVLQPGRFKP